MLLFVLQCNSKKAPY